MSRLLMRRNPRTEKVKFAASLAEMVFVYVLPQMTCFYCFSRLFRL